MGKIEEALKPSLRSLVLGDARVVPQDVQHLLAVWAIKTAMVAEHLFADEAFVSQEDRTFLMERQTPPPGWFVWIGAHTSDEWIEKFHHEAGSIGPPEGPGATTHKVQSLALGIGCLFVYVIGTTAKTLSFPNDDPTRSAIIPIWPLYEAQLAWPRRFLLDTNSANAVSTQLHVMGFPPLS